MRLSHGWLAPAIAVASFTLLAGRAEAARVRYHYVPGPAGSACFQLDGSAGAPGQRLTWRMAWEPFNCPPPRPTNLITYRHPCTGQAVTVPIALGLGTPRVYYRGSTVVYDYGTDSMQVQFETDGTVYVIYDSGLLRAPGCGTP
jgi:hypothetical protein